MSRCTPRPPPRWGMPHSPRVPRRCRRCRRTHRRPSRWRWRFYTEYFHQDWVHESSLISFHLWNFLSNSHSGIFYHLADNPIDNLSARGTQFPMWRLHIWWGDVQRRWTKKWSLGWENVLPGSAWLLLSKTGPLFSPSLYNKSNWLIWGEVLIAIALSATLSICKAHGSRYHCPLHWAK